MSQTSQNVSCIPGGLPLDICSFAALEGITGFRNPFLCGTVVFDV